MASPLPVRGITVAGTHPIKTLIDIRGHLCKLIRFCIVLGPPLLVITEVRGPCRGGLLFRAARPRITVLDLLVRKPAVR